MRPRADARQPVLPLAQAVRREGGPSGPRGRRGGCLILHAAAEAATGEPLILVTGATGYVGGRLVAALEADGRRLRCLTRRPKTLEARTSPTTEIAIGDVRDAESLRAALAGVSVAVYLIHSMGRSRGYRRDDALAARRFAEAAAAAGVTRIVYLGGLGRGAQLSSHLASRQEVGRALRSSGVPTVEFRSSIVIGSESLSFELIRALVDRLPAMVTPRWVSTRTQPIAIEDVIAYLVAGIDRPELSESKIVEIGGPDRVSYGDLMREYARQRGLRRVMVPVPVLTPRLSSLWLGLVTPVCARVGRELLEGLRNETVADRRQAAELFPSVRPRGAMDLIVGGPGMRRGRRDPESVAPGEALDCWRVEEYEPDRLLRLHAEMRLPGRAWLQFEVHPIAGGSTIHQTAVFDPVGLSGLAYWYGIWPIHELVFAGMLRTICRVATSESGATAARPAGRDPRLPRRSLGGGVT